MRRGNMLALTGLVAILGGARDAAAVDVTANRDAAASSCLAACCPTSVNAAVGVDPTTGLWTAAVTGVPVGGNPNNPVPIPCNGTPPAFSLRERKVVIRKVGSHPATETPGPWENVPPSQAGAPGGQTNGTSSRLVDGATDSTANDSEGVDVDVRIEFELTIRIACSGTGCASGNCVYVAKWGVTYDDGAASTAAM